MENVWGDWVRPWRTSVMIICPSCNMKSFPEYKTDRHFATQASLLEQEKNKWNSCGTIENDL
jgi:hypothetical protein